jgi:GUN4-like
MNIDPVPHHQTPRKRFVPRWVKLLGGGAIVLAFFNLSDIPYFLGYRQTTLDYRELESRLQAKDWDAADEITSNAMRELADISWLETDPVRLHRIPCADLQEMNRLWTDYSDGQYGLATQQEMFLAVKAGQETDSSNRFRRAELEQFTTFTRQVGHGTPTNSLNSFQPGHYPSFGVFIDGGETGPVTGVRPFSTPEMSRRLNWCRI